MTIANLNNSLNVYMNDFLKFDLAKIQVDEFVGQSQSSSKISTEIKKIESPVAIQDEYVPYTKQKVEVTLEERLSQVISPEEIKNLLSLLVKGPRISSPYGLLVDVKV